MGYMTELSIFNDMWTEICKKPDLFVDQIYESSISGGRSPDYIVGQTTVAKAHHADDIRVYFSGRNSFFDAYPDHKMSKDALERHLKYLKEMKGYIKISEEATKRSLGLTKQP